MRIGRRRFLTAASAGAWAVLAAPAKGGVIRAGILGTQDGHLNGKLKAMLNSPDYEVVAICEPDEAPTKETPERRVVGWPALGFARRIAR
jgi:hypothetical protein